MYKNETEHFIRVEETTNNNLFVKLRTSQGK